MNLLIRKAVAALGSATEAVGGTAMRFLGWFQSGEMELVPLNANAFLEMMSETTVAWLLLEAGVLAATKHAELPEGDKDRAFYAGKIASAKYYAETVLPNVKKNALVIGQGAKTALDIADEAFATV